MRLLNAGCRSTPNRSCINRCLPGRFILTKHKTTTFGWKILRENPSSSHPSDTFQHTPTTPLSRIQDEETHGKIRPDFVSSRRANTPSLSVRHLLRALRPRRPPRLPQPTCLVPELHPKLRRSRRQKHQRPVMHAAALLRRRRPPRRQRLEPRGAPRPPPAGPGRPRFLGGSRGPGAGHAGRSGRVCEPDRPEDGDAVEGRMSVPVLPAVSFVGHQVRGV